MSEVTFLTFLFAYLISKEGTKNKRKYSYYFYINVAYLSFIKIPFS